MQRNFAPMRKQVEAWQRSEPTDVTAKVVIYDASSKADSKPPNTSPAPDQNDCEKRVSRNSSHRQTWIRRLLRVSQYRSDWAVTKIPCVPKSLLLRK
jgi:hypothetical protein